GHEFVNLRAVVEAQPPRIAAQRIDSGTADASAALAGEQRVRIDGAPHTARIYDRAKLRAGNRVAGPAIVTQMDTTTLILPGHAGEVDAFGNILIRPEV
ncbi:MAG: hydantoinase/oxoprolinase family protein, partial [Hyphomicrobium sp.]|nr:hydantoinase/oxoprolinase family protein [Hyphomicrobium sp.]